MISIITHALMLKQITAHRFELLTALFSVEFLRQIVWWTFNFLVTLSVSTIVAITPKCDRLFEAHPWLGWHPPAMYQTGPIEKLSNWNSSLNRTTTAKWFYDNTKYECTRYIKLARKKTTIIALAFFLLSTLSSALSQLFHAKTFSLTIANARLAPLAFIDLPDEADTAQRNR